MKVKLLNFVKRMTKITIYACIMSYSLSMAFAVEGEAQRKMLNEISIHLDEQELKLTDLIREIEHSTDFVFAFSKGDVKGKSITLKSSDWLMNDLLKEISVQGQVSFRRVNESINIRAARVSHELPDVVESVDEQVSVSGIIADENGEPLPGATVQEKGTTNGTITNYDGTFSLQVPENAILTVSFVGYRTQEVALNGRSVLNLNLEADISALEEVVVVGYGTQNRADITGAVATMKADKLTERPISRLDQGLVGQVAGVRVIQTSGMPGKPFSIQIRGNGSISGGNEPLYVIDGFPVTTQDTDINGNFGNGSPLDNINPNDIASVEVLKDAAAAAIYGSRAANGVVLITTKKGVSRTPTFTFNTYSGVTQPAKKLDMLNSEEWIVRAKNMIDVQWERSGIPGAAPNQSQSDRINIYNAYRTSNGQSTVDPNDLTTYNTSFLYDPRWDMPGHPGLDFVDWQERMFRTGNFQNYQFSASGTTDAINYYVSANYNDNEGYITGTAYSQYSVRANIDAKLSERMRVGVNIAPSYSIRTDPGVEGKDRILHRMTSNTPVFEDDVNAEGKKYTVRYMWGSSGTDRLEMLERWEADNTIFRTLVTSYASYDILKNLTLKSTINFDNIDGTYEYYQPNNNVASIRGNYNTSRKQTYVNENTLNYSTKVGLNGNLSALAGYSYNMYQITSAGLSSGANYVSSSVKTLPANSTGSTDASRNVLTSLFGRVQYDLMSRYLVSASIRRDGSSKFGLDSRYGYFPSASVGWRLSEEAFLNSIDFVSDLKLRVSYGVSGSDNIGAYSWTSTLGTFNYVYTGGTSTAAGQGIATSPNPNLHWEQSNTTNFGLDFGIINNRLSGSFDYYKRITSDLLLNVPAPAASGFTTYLANVGEVENKGWELSLKSFNLTGEFEWSTSLNLSHNENKVLSLGPDQDQIEIGSGEAGQGTYLLKKGLPMYSFYLIQQDGVITQEDLDNYVPSGSETFPTYNNGTAYVGDPKYVDQNGDGQINSEDRVVVGNPYPKYIWGITNTLKYKGFDLNILVQGQNGGNIYSLLGRALNRTGMSSGENSLDVNPAERGNWKTNFGFVQNTDWLYKSDYFSVRNITLGYNFDRLFKDSDRISAARVFVTAENFIYFTSYTGGWNPEAVNFRGSSNSSFPVPADYGGAPLAKSLVFGVNLSFK